MAEQCSSVRQSASPVEAPSRVAEVKTVVATQPRKDKLVSAAKNAQVSTVAFAKNTQEKSLALVKNPHFQVITISTASGAVTLGTVGGAFGCMGGVVVGGLTGCVPALLTFGTSIPFGAVVGGFLGLTGGVCLGGTTGAAVGGGVGHGCYVYRAQIKDGVLRIKVVTTRRAQQFRLALKSRGEKTREFTMDTASKVKTFACDGTKRAKMLAVNVKQQSYELVSDKSFQVTSAAAVAGAATCGTAGGAVGTVAGAGAGMLVGLPAAFFTFGISVPVCATLGGGLGCAAGAMTGAAAGGLAGGTSAYNSHKYRKEIASGAAGAWNRLQTGTNKLKVKAMDSMTHVTAMVSGTGGTTGGAGSE